MKTQRPLFEHRHYVAMAAILAKLDAEQFGTIAPEDVARHFANELQGTNPAYDRTRFYEAATGKPNGRDRA